jgi:hypothetical protein
MCDNSFYEHPESSPRKNIKLQEFTVIAIYFACARSKGATLRKLSKAEGRWHK